jgi:hypothetical protein
MHATSTPKPPITKPPQPQAALAPPHHHPITTPSPPQPPRIHTQRSTTSSSTSGLGTATTPKQIYTACAHFKPLLAPFPPCAVRLVPHLAILAVQAWCGGSCALGRFQAQCGTPSCTRTSVRLHNGLLLLRARGGVEGSDDETWEVA